MGVTFVSVLFAEARANNEREFAKYLDLAESLEQRLLLPPRDDGVETLRRSHALWLELKHSHSESIDCRFGEHEERESEERREAARIAAAFSFNSSSLAISGGDSARRSRANAF